MTTTDATTEMTPVKGMFRELLWIHSMIRRDLDTVRQLAEDVRAGAAPEEVRSTLQGLQTRGPLWKLRVNCLAYCRFVHHHHSLEDYALFPMLRRVDPTLSTVIDRLEADHLQIASYLNAVETAAAALETTPGSGSDSEHRDQLAGALSDLADHLLSHLAFEEASIGPTLSEWDHWPAL